MSTKTVVLPIQGMTCASCVGHVERALGDVEGVTAARVNLASERATVEFNPNGSDLVPLIHAVRDAGYDVPTEEMTLPIGGMTCASCVGHVERALRDVEGVITDNVRHPFRPYHTGAVLGRPATASV